MVRLNSCTDGRDREPTTFFQRGDRISDEIGHEEFYIESYLGKGGFAECFSVKSSRFKERFALKIVDKAKLNDPYQTKMRREINLHKSVSHRNIVTLHGSFQDHNYFYLVMELCREHTLLSLVNQSESGHLTEGDSRRYLGGILAAVRYLLQRNILHRDLKPGNVLIGMNGDVKLADFGLAILRQDLNPASVSGTPNYLAPEGNASLQILLKRGHSEYSEVWSIGCILYCMLVGRPPFETDNLEDTYARIRACDYNFPSWLQVSVLAKQLIQCCLNREPDMRPSIASIQNDTWMHQGDVQTPVIMRTKSMKELYVNDVNGNLIMRDKSSRPKSTVDLMATSFSRYENKPRRKSVVGSHDSGFGSDPDISRRPLLATAVSIYLNDIGALLSNSCSFILSPSPMPDVFVSKWVDYSNRRGFGCQLSDGSLSVKFNEGLCLSWPYSSSTILYATTPFSIPRRMHLLDIHDGNLTQNHIEIARQYREYMNRELADCEVVLPTRGERRYDSPYLVANHLDSNYLIMVFSDGTVQVNLMKKRTKIVLWNDTSSRCTSIAVMERGFIPQAYRIQSGRIYGTKLTHSLFGMLRDVRHAIASECDFLHASRKPIQSTEC
uniref:Serine/threonine-protein kinase PLK n=1 Tax=Heterorhabditis bacteriophora TaxID=37862 RepID=A0A1I7XQ07_HETBA